MNGNDDFFGGSIVPVAPAPTAAPKASNPQATDVYAPPSASLRQHTAEDTQAAPARIIIMVLVGTLVAFLAFVGFRVITSGTQIVLPDELMGLQRVDADSELAQGLEGNWSEFESLTGTDVEIETAAYTGAGQVLVVAAAENGLSDPAEQERLFNGIAQGFGESGAQGQFTQVDPGTNGGRMQCVNTMVAGASTDAGACTWVSEDTFGMVMLIAPQSDVAESTRIVREAIEQ